MVVNGSSSVVSDVATYTFTNLQAEPGLFARIKLGAFTVLDTANIICGTQTCQHDDATNEISIKAAMKNKPLTFEIELVNPNMKNTYTLQVEFTTGRNSGNVVYRYSAEIGI